MGGSIFPPFNDPANWLKISNALNGVTFPMWEQTALQYPPFFMLLLSALGGITGDPLLAIRLAGVLVAAIVPLSAYPISKQVSGSGASGLAAAWLVGLSPIFFEMYGWGGYPNLLGLTFLMLSLYFLLKALSDPSRWYFVGALTSSSLVVLTHHLTLIAFAPLAALLGLISLRRAFEGPGEARTGALHVLASLAASALVFLVWRAAAGPFQYLISNPASLRVRPFDSEAFWWIFKSQAAASLLFFTAILGSLALYLSRRRLALALLLLWASFPFFFTQFYVFGISLDFKRFPAFSVPALGILSACSLLLLEGRSGFDVKGVRPAAGGNGLQLSLDVDIGRAVIASLLLLTVLANSFLGVATAMNVFTYYHYTTDYAYSDRERYDALRWIRDNTPAQAVLVADETMGRWIEGLSQRRVLLELSPYQVFMTGELERYQAASLLLSDNMELRNEYLFIADGAPYSPLRTPWFAVSDGPGYVNVVYIIDSAIETTFSYGGGSWIESPYMANVTDAGVQEGPTSASLSITYQSRSLRMTRVISLSEGSKEVQLEYYVEPTMDARLDQTRLPIWIPYGSSISEPLYYSGALHITVNGVPILVTTSGNVSVGADPRWGQQRMLFTFSPSDDRVSARVTLTFPSAQKSWWSDGLWAQTSDALIRRYDVGYIVMEKPKDDFIRLLQDSRMQVAYENEKFIIFRVNPRA
jgi:hypothetical protein